MMTMSQLVFSQFSLQSGAGMLAFIPGMPGGIELVVFLLIVLLLFGKRLPTAMFSVGKSITEFKKGMNEPVSESLNEDSNSEEEKSE